MNLFGVGCSSDDDPSDAAKGGAGQGGSGKTDGGGAPGGSGGAGTPATVGGEGGSLSFDPSCSCTVDRVDGQVDCTFPIEQAARMGIPTSCENDLDYVYVDTCEDGATRTVWLEGSENDYMVVRDSQARAVYAEASGYVGHICDTGPDVTRVTAGRHPPLRGCSRCVVCESVQGGAGGTSTTCSP